MEKRNLPASIHQRLLNKSHQTGRTFNELLPYYGIERLLYRLSVSEHARKFVLKGALMFNVWGVESMRPTRDIDLLGYTSNAVESIEEIFHTVCQMNVEADGLEFDDALQAEHIKEEADYVGVRITVAARLGKIKFPIQIDIGFADVITPAPEKLPYPTLLDYPAPFLYGYPRETVIAEKIHAMTILEMARRNGIKGGNKRRNMEPRRQRWSVASQSYRKRTCKQPKWTGPHSDLRACLELDMAHIQESNDDTNPARAAEAIRIGTGTDAQTASAGTPAA